MLQMFIFPVIIPGLIIQWVFQVYYVYHLIKKDWKKAKKAWYAFLIMIGGFPFLAFYHRIHRKDDQPSIDWFNTHSLFYLIMFTFQVYALQYFISNQSFDYSTAIRFSISILYVLFFIAHLIADQKKPFLFNTIYSLMLILAFMTEYMNHEFNTPLMLINVLSFMMIHLKEKQLPLFLLISVFILLIANFIKGYLIFDGLHTQQAWSVFTVNYVASIIILVIFYGLRYLKTVNTRLNLANEHLHRQQEQIEKLTIESERYRIAHEMHDSVGHHLTASLITLESMEKQCGNQDELHHVQHHVRQALNEVRTLVHHMDLEHESSLKAKIEHIIEDMNQGHLMTFHLEYAISHEMPLIYQRFMMNTLKECITNSIKHGHAKTMDILFSESLQTYFISISDDGIGSPQKPLGFGLTGIKHMTEQLGGKMKIQTTPDEGFTLSIQLPVPVAKEDYHER